MKQELIKLSSENGFSSQVIGKSVNSKYSSKTELFYLLWMTEVQKWLREEHGIVLTIQFIRQNSVLNGYEFFYDAAIKTFDSENVYQKDFFPRKGLFKTYEQALEEGLGESLKLIK